MENKKDTLNIRYIFRARSKGIAELKKIAVREEVSVSKLIRKTIKENPDRIKEVNKEIEAFGAKVLEQYSILGPYDFMNIVEAPNNEAINKISIELGSRGTVEIMSMPAMQIEDFISVIKKRTRKRITN